MNAGGHRETLEREIESLTEILSQAFETLRQGHAPVLGDLGLRVERLCRDVSESAPAVAESLRPLLAGLIQRLDELALDIQTFQSGLKEAKAP